METIIEYYILDWNTTSSIGKIVLKLEDGEAEVLENLSFNAFTAIALVLAHGSSKFDSTTHSVFNYKTL